MTLAPATTTTLDVRDIAPGQRHSTVFAAFKNLDVGATLDLIHDHDPKLLNAQFQAEMPGGFSWSHIQSGPEVWRVAIRKLSRSHGAGGCCGACGG